MPYLKKHIQLKWGHVPWHVLSDVNSPHLFRHPFIHANTIGIKEVSQHVRLFFFFEQNSKLIKPNPTIFMTFFVAQCGLEKVMLILT